MSFSWENWTTGLIVLGYDLLVILTIVILVFRRRETASIFSWSLAILFMPGLGLILFYLFGLRRFPRRLKKKILHKTGFERRFPGRPSSFKDSANDQEVKRDPWAGIHRVGEMLGASPVRYGNRIEMLTSGEETFNAIFSAIEAATHHVHVQKYIFRRDRLGLALMNLLIEKARQGVEVRLIVDAVGSFGIWRLLRALKNEGGQGAIFLPLLPFPKRMMPNLRNHRKIVVCDGKTGFMGGINVGEEYLGKSRTDLTWLDAHLVIQGPAVLDLQRVFIEDWDLATSQLLSDAVYFPAHPDSGEHSLQILPSGPDQEVNAARQVFLAAINQSHEELLLASPYVVPDISLRDALINAGLRGVRVVLLTQRTPPDHWLPYWSSRYHWKSLLEAGVTIHSYQPGMMHAKILVADQAWASVGSANFDTRSLQLNFEVSGITRDPDLVKKIRESFLLNLRQSPAIDMTKFTSRPWKSRACEGFAHLFSPLL